MTTKAFDLATLIPDEAAVVGNTIVVSTTSPLNMNWTAMSSGGAFVPAANAQNQTIVSGPNPYAWSLSTAILEASIDGFAYGRMNAGWTKVLPLAGGTMTGTLTLAGPPTNPNEPSTKAYADNVLTSANTYTNTQISNANLDCGTY